jgi:NAD(P)-dependent dehydrogenase (short-subunit alcohol dehydrogenase family)
MLCGLETGTVPRNPTDWEVPVLGAPLTTTERRLAGRVGLITGAASGIGAAGAKLFAAHGASLVLVDADAARGERTAAAIAAQQGRVVFVHGDASDPSDVSRAVRVAVDSFGKLDLLWANAGIGVSKTVPDMTVAEWRQVLEVNLTGAFLVAKFGIPELIDAGGGTMVMTGSANCFTADRSWAAYCASKGGLLMLCRALALDHAGDGIRVNIVCPGSVSTPLHEAWLNGRPGGRPLAEVREEDRAAHPLHRVAEPGEVALAALFLSCSESSFTTGTPLLVDGGVTA